ncbi:hypothetical protein H9P43_006322 [Blastocladiella emersonii ATCC 22665]|nr:hypothetical protein H9P43_006322 [Blastocladiella emersonii ATCC 22665]
MYTDAVQRERTRVNSAMTALLRDKKAAALRPTLAIITHLGFDPRRLPPLQVQVLYNEALAALQDASSGSVLGNRFVKDARELVKNLHSDQLHAGDGFDRPAGDVPREELSGLPMAMFLATDK